MTIIKDFEAVLSEKERGGLEQYEEAVEGNSEEENSVVKSFEGEKSKDESSEANADACTHFLSIINDCEDVLTEKERGRLEYYEYKTPWLFGLL